MIEPRHPESAGPECHIPSDVRFGRNVTMEARVVFTGSDITVGDNVNIFSASVIADGVVIGSWELLRPGSVVLRSVPANAIVEGNPVAIAGYSQDASSTVNNPSKVIDIEPWVL